jgi:hypothetical protein
MGWWMTENGTIGDRPADILDDALDDIEAAYLEEGDRLPTQGELAELIDFCTGGALKPHCRDSKAPWTKTTAYDDETLRAAPRGAKGLVIFNSEQTERPEQSISLSHVWERLHLAVVSLVTGHGTIRERLTNALRSHLTPGDFPVAGVLESLQGDLEAIHQALASPELAAVTLTEDQAARIAEQVVSLHDMITRQHAIEGYRFDAPNQGVGLPDPPSVN